MNKGAALSTAEPRGASRWALRMHSLLIYVFFYAPIVVLVIYSFNDAQLVGQWKGFSLGWYEAFLCSWLFSSPSQVALVCYLQSLSLGPRPSMYLPFSPSPPFYVLLVSDYFYNAFSRHVLVSDYFYNAFSRHSWGRRLPLGGGGPWWGAWGAWALPPPTRPLLTLPPLSSL